MKKILDACCGSRMFWFDKKNPDVVFLDKRSERHELPDVSSSGGRRSLVIEPDLRADFTALPFRSEVFQLVVFDPPHFLRNGASSWVGLKYGTLTKDWREILRQGFAECFRVLCNNGVLIFKWCDIDLPLSQILALAPCRPLVGHKSGKNSNTHWVTFLKSKEIGALDTEEERANSLQQSYAVRFAHAQSSTSAY